MKEIRTELEIDAPPDRVWDVLADFARYGEWNPFIVEIRARLEPGADVDFIGRLGRRDLKIRAAMVEAEAPKGFWWRGPRSKALARLFNGEHYFEVHALEGDRCRFVHGERFRGLLIPVLSRFLDRRLTPVYRDVNAALKRRVESASKATS